MKRLISPKALRLAPVLLAALLALGGCSGGSEADLLASARSHLAKNETESARLDLKTLLQKSPQSAEARLLLGKVLHDTGDMVGAEVELRRALELGQSETTTLPLLAGALVAQGKGGLLLQQFGKVNLPEAQADAEFKTHLAGALAGDNDLNAAADMLAQALKQSPQHAPAMLLGVRLAAAKGDLDGALAQLEALLARKADLAEAWTLKGDLLQRARPAKTDAALAAYRQTLKLRPDAVTAHGAAIALLLGKGDVAGATAQWTAMQKAAPKHSQTMFFEALLAEQRGDFKLARELTQQLLRNAPNSPQVLMLAAEAESGLGALEQAESLFAKAVQLVPKVPGPRRKLASLQMRNNQPDKALATLKPLLEAQPPDVEALALAGQAQLMLGDSKAATAIFAQASKLKPEDARLRTAMALSQLGRGQDAAAFNDLQTIAAADKGIGADIALISARIRAKDYAGALKAVDGLAAKQPKAPLADHLRARIALQKEDNAGARKHFESAIAKDADYMPALAGLAALDLADKQPAAARARFEALLKRQPENPGAMMALAEIGKRSGARAEQTVQLLEQAIKVNPADPRPRMMLVDEYLGARQFKPALTTAAAAVAALPGNLELIDRLGRAQLLGGDAQQAVSTFTKLVGLAPKAALPQLRLADAQAAANNRSAAVAAVRRAAELAPGSLPVLQAQANLALLDNKPEQALTIARKLQTDQPDAAIGFAMEGDIALRLQRWDDAAAALRKAITRKEPGLSLQRLHAALTAGKKTAEADKLAADWRKSHPDDMGFVLHLGDMALSAGNKAQAETLYRQVVDTEPGNVVALNNLAYLLAQMKKPGAVAMAEQALKAAPDSPALLDTLAFALAADNQLPRAIEAQSRAVATAPNAPQFTLQLARLYLQSGDKPSAREQLNKLARLGAAFQGQAEVAEMLKATGG